MTISHKLSASIIALALVGTLPAAAAVKKAAPRASSPACTKLTDKYENFSKELSAQFADSIGDNSAARATMREARSMKIMTEANLTIGLMRTHGCNQPSEAPSEERYQKAALDCAFERRSANIAALRGLAPATEFAGCDWSKWKAGK